MTRPSAGELGDLAPELSGNSPPGGWQLVASSAGARVLKHAEWAVFYKEFLPRGPLERLKSLARGSRATRARLGSEALLYAGFEAPTNLAWGHLPGGREYLFTGAAPGEGVARWLLEILPAGQSAQRARRRLLLRALGRHIGRLHASGFIHGDLRSSNILASWRGDAFNFCLIDNERTVRRDRPSGRQILRNLMQLNMHTPTELSGTDRWRFFLAWREQQRELTAVESRILAREAYRWAMRRLAAKGKLS